MFVGQSLSEGKFEIGSSNPQLCVICMVPTDFMVLRFRSNEHFCARVAGSYKSEVDPDVSFK